jgi:hypothetical protein
MTGAVDVLQIVETGLQFRGGLTARKQTDYIVLHHADASRCTVYDVHQWHLNNGWAGIGYAYFVDKQGAIFRGRPRDAVGAQCEGYNFCSLGICAEGNYEQEQMPAAQRQAIAALLAELGKIYPGARIVGHRDLNATSCPGRYYPFDEIVQTASLLREVEDLFKDVPENHWARGSIERLAQLGLLKGDEQGNFRPDEPLTRAQLAAVLDRLLKLLGR